MADADLPVWTIPHNWSSPLSERLEWLSSVFGSGSGAEQRRKVRLTPRREFETKVNPTGRTRSYLDLWLNNIGGDECLFPLWFDKGRLDSASAGGASRLSFDTTYREFAAGQLALVHRDAWTWELVEIEAVDDEGIDLVAPLTSAWAKGSAVYPLRVCTLNLEVTSAAITSRVGDASLTFKTNRANPLDGGDETLTMFGGFPVLTAEPDRVNALEVQYQRIMEELDPQIGRRKRYDEGGRAFPTKFYNWQPRGRQAHMEQRQLLYRLAGKRGTVWVPSFNEDLTLTTALSAVDAAVNVEKIGYQLLGGVTGGREYFMIRDSAQTPRFLRINGVGAAPGPDKERLNLSAAAGFTAPVGRTGSFMDTCRLDQDSVEIIHHTDTDGVAECGVAVKAFKNSRVAPNPLVLATPAAVETDTGCGVPADVGPCYPTFAVFEGWYVEYFIEYGLDFPTTEGSSPDTFVANYGDNPLTFDGGIDEIVYGAPTVEEVAARTVTIRHITAGSYAPQMRALRIHPSNGTVPAGSKARCTARRWDGGASFIEPNSTYAPSYSYGTPKFDMSGGGAFPLSWFFYF